MNANMLANKTPCIVLMSFVLFLFSNCQNANNADKTTATPLTRDSIFKHKASLPSESDQQDVFQDTGKQAKSAKQIEGTYVVINEPGESDKCTMTIVIEKTSGGYTYKFNTESRSLSGKLSVEATEGKDGYYITLEGIEWSEYEGALDDQGEAESKEPLALPVGINGVIQDNEITIQNTGNSMNYYVKLEDCGEKYIRLQKQ
jgi:hypothetical protein